MATEYLEEIGEFPEETKKFTELEEFSEYFDSERMCKYIKEKWGGKMPKLFKIRLKKHDFFVHLRPDKRNIEMDWHFFCGSRPITEADITAETNTEKRRLLIMEYGVGKYLKDLKVLDTNSHYGTLIEATIDGERHKFLRFRNGSPERDPESIRYLKERNMLTEDNHKIYYENVRNKHNTVLDAVAEAWDIPKDWLNPNGYETET